MSGFRSSAILGLRRPRLSGTRSTSATASAGLTSSTSSTRRARGSCAAPRRRLRRDRARPWRPQSRIYACARPIIDPKSDAGIAPVRVIEADVRDQILAESSVLLCDRVARGRSARRVCARPRKWRAQGSLLIGRGAATAVRPRELEQDDRPPRPLRVSRPAIHT